MSPPTSEELVEIITREVFRVLQQRKSTGDSSIPPASGSIRCGTPELEDDSFILAPEILPFDSETAPEEQTIAKGYVPIGISARHCHVSKKDLEILFGPGAELTKYRDLYQRGEFAAEQTVTLIGPRMRSLEGVRILGPCRGDTQVEISLTDSVHLGLKPPVRPSGNHEGTPGILMVGPKGSVTLSKGVIRANRHIHLGSSEARVIGVVDNEKVLVRIAGDRAVIYYDVQVRVKDSFRAEMHLDTDDANAVGAQSGDRAQIIRGYHECRLCEASETK